MLSGGPRYQEAPQLLLDSGLFYQRVQFFNGAISRVLHFFNRVSMLLTAPHHPSLHLMHNPQSSVLVF